MSLSLNPKTNFKALTFSDFQLSFGLAQCTEQIQFDSCLRRQRILEMSVFLLHRRQRGHEYLGVA